jgi:predicted ArsR family transcriptional regulator
VKIEMTKLMEALNGENMVSLQELSETLDMNAELVKAELEFLERHGYIKKATGMADCRRSCHGCSGCSFAYSFPVMWEIA